VNTDSKKLATSPDRNTFQHQGYLKRRAEKGLTPENDEDTRAMDEWYKSWTVEEEKREQDPEWRKINLEYDLRSTDWIVQKVRDSEFYAQNLYAAMCNMSWCKLVTENSFNILKEETWSCSWRYAGGIVAHMRGEGDYIDWYCSGIVNSLTDEERAEMTEEAIQKYELYVSKTVGEGYVTKEIAEDLRKLDWIPVPDEEDQLL
jgi:hypothetical protein